MLCQVHGATGAAAFTDGSFVTLRVELSLVARMSFSGRTATDVLEDVRAHVRKQRAMRRRQRRAAGRAA